LITSPFFGTTYSKEFIREEKSMAETFEDVLC